MTGAKRHLQHIVLWLLILSWTGGPLLAQEHKPEKFHRHIHKAELPLPSTSGINSQTLDSDITELRLVPTEHFTLWTDTDESYARGLASYLDVYHSLMHDHLQKLIHVHATLPEIKIILFERQEDYQEFAMKRAPLLVKNGGYYDGATKSIVTYRYNNSIQLYFHEISHALMGEVFDDHFFYRYTRRGWPVWFDEGLAEYFGSFANRDGKLVIGTPNPTKIAYLVNAMKTDTLVSLRTLLTSSGAAFNGDRMNMFYAASWGLVRFLITHESYSRGLPEFVSRLRAGDDGLLAFRESFSGDFEKMEDEWRTWLEESAKPKETLQSLFNGRTIDEWAIHEGGFWWVKNATIHARSDGAYNYLIRSTLPRGEFRLHLQVRVDAGIAGIVLGNNYHGEYPYYYLIELSPTHVAIRQSHSPTKLVTIASVDASLNPGEWLNVDVEVRDGRLRVSVDENIQLEAEENHPLYSIVGLYLFEATAQFRDILIGAPPIRPAAPGSISP